MGIFAMVGLLALLFIVLAIVEGVEQFCDWMKEEAEFRKALKSR